MSFFDFNTADQQQSFDLIPKGTLARVRMSIKPGGFDDASQGWTGGWATQSHDTGAVYLACEGVVMEGPFARRKVWWNIGLYSAKGPTWGNMGRTFVRAALNSARNIHPGDNSPQAQAARRISGFGDLEGLEFVARFDIEKDGRGEDKNTIKSVIETAGGTMEDVTFNQIFLKSWDDYAAMNKVYAEFFPGEKPARYCIQCGLVKPDALVEIATVAHIGK